MSWGEAYRLAQILADDLSSRVGAALADLRAPASPESVALYLIAQNYFASHTEQRPKLIVPNDPLATAPQPRAQLSAAEVDGIFRKMQGGGDV